jgi:hypothetical protein
VGTVKTHRTKIRQHLRSARASALTVDERRAEMRGAEARAAGRDADEGAAGAAAGPVPAQSVNPEPATESPAP